MISLSLGQLSVTRSASSFVLSSSLAPSTFPLASLPIRPLPPPSLSLLRSQSPPHSHQLPQNPADEDDAQLEDLRVPPHWLLPSNAFQESEWLRLTLHKWLDDEYCPEETNVEISKVAAQSYYTSLLEKKTDLGEILLRMARELESISYQESFHGAFSSANAAVNLIAQRIEDSCQPTWVLRSNKLTGFHCLVSSLFCWLVWNLLHRLYLSRNPVKSCPFSPCFKFVQNCCD